LKKHTRRRSMSSLRGARVLVVEDEAMLSLNLEAMLLDLGCVVAGTADKLDNALQLARTSDFDVALLDINLGGKRVDPVADAIGAGGPPIVFVTGYGKTAAWGLVLEKPYDAAALERMLNEALGASSQKICHPHARPPIVSSGAPCGHGGPP